LLKGFAGAPRFIMHLNLCSNHMAILRLSVMRADMLQTSKLTLRPLSSFWKRLKKPALKLERMLPLLLTLRHQSSMTRKKKNIISAKKAKCLPTRGW